MRRGLIIWDKVAEPAGVFDDRIARMQTAMSEHGFDAVLVYTNFPRPAAVSYLTHFVPYWNQGVLIVPREGGPVLAIALSKRVQGWIEEVSHLAEIVSTPRLGNEVASRLAGAGKVGVVDLAKMPAQLLGPLSETGSIIADGTPLYDQIRYPADATELALSEQAAAIARKALDDAAPESHTPIEALAAAERSARAAGAEEVLIDVCDKLDTDPTFRRAQGTYDFGDRFALRVSVANRGYWVRAGRSYVRSGAAPDQTEALASRIAPSSHAGLVLEGAKGTLPLTAFTTVPPGAIVSATVTFTEEGKTWLAAAPFHFDGNGTPNPLLR